MKITILTEAEIRQCVQLDLAAISAVEEGFARLAKGEATVPPIIGVEVPDVRGEVDVKMAYVQGLSGLAVKVASGFYDNEKLGLPTSGGIMLVISTRTGFPEAVLLDNGYLTQVRTGAAGAIAAKYLAPERVDTAGVIGAGTQGRYQMAGLKLVRDYRRLLVFDMEPAKANEYAVEMAARLGVEVTRAPDMESLVHASDVVVTTTPSRQPYLKPEWLHPGLHITAMGADMEEKRELCAGVLQRADILACDRKAQCFVRGELHHGLAEGAISQDDPIIELGDLILGRAPGRRSDQAQAISICDLTGVGVQDTAIALLAYHNARQRGLGKEIEA